MNYDLLCMSTFSLSITKCALCEDNIRCQLEKELKYRTKKELENKEKQNEQNIKE